MRPRRALFETCCPQLGPTSSIATSSGDGWAATLASAAWTEPKVARSSMRSVRTLIWSPVAGLDEICTWIEPRLNGSSAVSTVATVSRSLVGTVNAVPPSNSTLRLKPRPMSPIKLNATTTIDTTSQIRERPMKSMFDSPRISRRRPSNI